MSCSPVPVLTELTTITTTVVTMTSSFVTFPGTRGTITRFNPGACTLPRAGCVEPLADTTEVVSAPPGASFQIPVLTDIPATITESVTLFSTCVITSVITAPPGTGPTGITTVTTTLPPITVPGPTPSGANQGTTRSNVAPIVGGIIGGLILSIFTVFLIWWYKYRKMDNKDILEGIYSAGSREKGRSRLSVSDSAGNRVSMVSALEPSTRPSTRDMGGHISPAMSLDPTPLAPGANPSDSETEFMGMRVTPFSGSSTSSGSASTSNPPANRVSPSTLPREKPLPVILQYGSGSSSQENTRTSTSVTRPSSASSALQTWNDTRSSMVTIPEAAPDGLPWLPPEGSTEKHTHGSPPASLIQDDRRLPPGAAAPVVPSTSIAVAVAEAPDVGDVPPPAYSQ